MSVAGLIEFVKTETREELVATNSFVRQGFDFTILDRSAALEQRFGSFSLIVNGNEASISRASINHTSPDRRGITWDRFVSERGKPTAYWAARKLHANIELIWRTERKSVDRRWVELDRFLRSFTNG